jgi:hypothetical protein
MYVENGTCNTVQLTVSGPDTWAINSEVLQVPLATYIHSTF